MRQRAFVRRAAARHHAFGIKRQVNVLQEIGAEKAVRREQDVACILEDARFGALLLRVESRKHGGITTDNCRDLACFHCRLGQARNPRTAARQRRREHTEQGAGLRIVAGRRAIFTAKNRIGKRHQLLVVARWRFRVGALRRQRGETRQVTEAMHLSRKRQGGVFSKKWLLRRTIARCASSIEFRPLFVAKARHHQFKRQGVERAIRHHQHLFGALQDRGNRLQQIAIQPGQHLRVHFAQHDQCFATGNPLHRPAQALYAARQLFARHARHRHLELVPRHRKNDRLIRQQRKRHQRFALAQ